MLRQEQRFWAKVAVAKVGECWNWKAGISNGYGQFALAHNKRVAAHRYSYEQQMGPIPEGLELDHLCRNKACVNPGHLEAVTHHENLLRGPTKRVVTHCPQGHLYDEENTHYRPDGRRRCCECGRRWCRESRQRIREVLNASAE